MPGLDCRTVVEKDKAGAVRYSGARWNENAGLGPGLKFIARVILILAALLFLGLMILANSGGRIPFISDVINLCMLAAIGLCLYFAFTVGKAKSVEIRFYDDGSIETRRGASEKGVRRWGNGWHHDNIAKFEAVGRMDDKSWVVNLMSNKGDTVHLSSYFWREDARKIVFTLDEALKTIRGAALSRYSFADEEVTPNATTSVIST